MKVSYSENIGPDLPKDTLNFWRRVRLLALDVDIRHNSQFGLEVGITRSHGTVFIQILCERPDTYTGEFGTGQGGKRYLSPKMTDSEIVRAIWGAFLAYVEHEAREAFTYKGKRIYGPHIDIEALVEVADRIEDRKAAAISDDVGDANTQALGTRQTPR